MGPAGVERRKPQKGFPAWTNVVLESRGERGSGRQRKTPGCVACAPAPAASEVPGRAAELPRLDAGWNPGECAGVRAAEARRRRRVKPSADGRAAGLPEGKAVCGHVVRYVLRARAASRSRATSKPAARFSRLPPRRPAPPALCLRVSAAALVRVDCTEGRGGARRGQRPPARRPFRRSPPPTVRELLRSGRPWLFLMPMFGVARGRACDHLRSVVITRHAAVSPPPKVLQDPFCSTRGQNRPQHLKAASFLPHFCPFKCKYGHHRVQGSSWAETLGVQSLV